MEDTFCINHPNTSTVLRCNKCGNPICPRCAVPTPVGYRCKNCVKNQQAMFYTALWYDYLTAGVVTLIISGLAQAILVYVPFFLLVIFAGAIVGGVVAEAVRLVNRKRRGRYIWLVVAVCIVIASVPVLLFSLLGFDFAGLIINGVYLVLAVGAASARLRIGRK